MRARNWTRATVGVALCVAAAAAVQWRIAELAKWSIDEAANLWLGTIIRDGNAPGVGLASSVGTKNLAGAPLLAAPLSLLPDLLAVARGLALAELVPMVALALAIARDRRGRLLAVALLVFCPASMLAASSLWNQYLALPITAAITALLLVLAERSPLGRGRGFVATALLVMLLLFQPGVHLAGFADLAAQGALAMTLLGLAGPRTRPAALELAVAIGCCALLVLYRPWLSRTFVLQPSTALLVYCAVAAAVVVGLDRVLGRLQGLAPRVTEARWLAWTVPVLLVICAGSAALTFFGAQAGARLLLAGGWGVALLCAQVAVAALALPAIPGMIADCRSGATPRQLLRAWFPGREAGAALLLANAALLLAARAALVPAAFLPDGRPDLLLPLLPALLAPALLLVAVTPRTPLRAWASAIGGALATVAVAFATFGVNVGFEAHSPRFIPASEARALVDWIAAQPGAVGADGRVDVGYDLDEGSEWLIRVACHPTIAPWYTFSRPFDWLFLRRHGLRDAREGTCTRGGGGRWLVTYRLADPPAGRRRRLELEHLVVWE